MIGFLCIYFGINIMYTISLNIFFDKGGQPAPFWLRYILPLFFGSVILVHFLFVRGFK